MTLAAPLTGSTRTTRLPVPTTMSPRLTGGLAGLAGSSTRTQRAIDGTPRRLTTNSM
jgi:hypothetical protein